MKKIMSIFLIMGHMGFVNAEGFFSRPTLHTTPHAIAAAIGASIGGLSAIINVGGGIRLASAIHTYLKPKDAPEKHASSITVTASKFLSMLLLVYGTGFIAQKAAKAALNGYFDYTGAPACTEAFNTAYCAQIFNYGLWYGFLFFQNKKAIESAFGDAEIDKSQPSRIL